MTPKVKIFENVFPDSSTGHRTTFCGQFGENWLLRSSRKVVWITTQKNSGSAELVPAPILPKMSRSPQNSLNVVFDVSKYTEFGPDRLRFAGLIPERLIFRPKKSIQYRLLAYSYTLAMATYDIQ